MRAASATGARFENSRVSPPRKQSSGCLVRAQAPRLIQRPICERKIRAFTRTPRAAPWRSRGWRAVYSRVRLAGLALAIRTVALGGPKAAPVGIAPAPLSFRALASRAKLFGANWPSTSSMFIARASANALPARPSWTSRAPTSAKACAAMRPVEAPDALREE